MPVPLGAVASVINIATFPLDLAEAVHRIKEFCDRVSNAPEELQDVVDQISIMSDLMSQLSAAPAEGQTMERHCLKQCLDLCSRALERIRTVAKEMQDQLAKHKLRAAVKIALKQNVIDRMMKRLEHGKGLLQLAYQAYTSAQSRDLMTAQQNCIRDLFAGQTVILQRTRHFERSENSYNTADLAFSEKYKCQKQRRKENAWEREIYRIETPTWLLSRVWFFAINRTLTGWTFPLQSYRILSERECWEDPAFLSCIKDDVLSLRRLLESRQATIRDQFIPGVSLFQVAIESAATDVMYFLYQHGATEYSLKEFYSPIDSLWMDCIPDGHNCRCQDWTLAKMVTHAIRFQSLLEDLEIDISKMKAYKNVAQTLSTPIEHWTEADKIEALHFLLYVASRYNHHLSKAEGCSMIEALYKDIIGTDCKESLFRAKTLDGKTLTHCLAYAIAALPDLKSSPYFAKIAVGLVTYADLHSSGKGSCYNICRGLLHTALATLLREACRRLDKLEDVQCVLHAWLELLVVAGVDLLTYGDVEVFSPMGGIRDMVFHLEPIVGGPDWDRERYTPELASCRLGTHGPEPADWQIWFCGSFEAYSGEFWDMIENPEYDIPGAWMDIDE